MQSEDRMNKLFLCFGNQLFHPRHLTGCDDAHFLLVEDPRFCERYAYHKQKLLFVLAAMRSYRDLLRRHGFKVSYYPLEERRTWRSVVREHLSGDHARTLCHFELENPDLTAAVSRFAQQNGLQLEVRRTPMFLNTAADFTEHLDTHGSPKLLPFYREQRRRRNILVTRDGDPVGGRWSFDQENRARLPRDVNPAPPSLPRPAAPVIATRREVAERFPANPGSLEHFWLPTTHQQAEDWLEEFLATRFWSFGTYEDALTERSPFVYHSGLAPLLNVGLLTPAQVVERALDYAGEHNVPVNSLEGFIRQIIGWREFVRGVFHRYYEPMQSRNIWNGTRKLTSAWYEGTTGITPMDHVIRKTLELGWAHHIERLMVAANLMNLAGIQPQEVYRWFMEMFVDAYDWVMVPNVFGMGLTSEGGIFTTKPYICGSNYVLKMGDFKRGDWCDVMDGLLWRFVANHEQTLKANHRLAPMVANLRRVARRRPEIFELADRFIETTTEAA
jgi:deoxyribodipyrimidine photolyase-related protein